MRANSGSVVFSPLSSIIVVCVLIWLLSFVLLRRHAPHARLSGVESTSQLFLDERKSCLLLAGRVRGVDSFYLIDTGYAGPPVLNTDYLEAMSRSAHLRPRVGRGEGPTARRDAALLTMRELRSAASLHAPRGKDEGTLQRYMTATSSIDFTAGCRVRLMGISATTERHSDLILSDELLFLAPEGHFASPRSNTDLPRGEVFVTNRIASTPHILTADYIRHHAPCCLQISRSKVEWCVPNTRFLYLTSIGGYVSVPCVIVGGAYAIAIRVGGAVFRCVLDTGSESCLTIGSRSAARIGVCTDTARTASSVGVGGLRSCSRLVNAPVTLAGLDIAACPVAVSSFDTSSVDGFVGMGVLRCFEWLLTARAVFARGNGLSPASVDELSARGDGGGCTAPPLPDCGL